MIPQALDERGVEPLDVVALGIKQEHLVADDGHGQEKHGADGHRQSGRAHPQRESVPVHVGVLLPGVHVLVARLTPELAKYQVGGKVQKHEEQEGNYVLPDGVVKLLFL